MISKESSLPNTITYIPLPVTLIATERSGKPAIEIRRLITDENYIKIVLSAAFYNVPIVIQPIFTNELKSISTLIEKGILFFNKETDKYEFTF